MIRDKEGERNGGGERWAYGRRERGQRERGEREGEGEVERKRIADVNNTRILYQFHPSDRDTEKQEATSISLSISYSYLLCLI